MVRHLGPGAGEEAADRLSFRRFLGFPDSPPDYSTVWQFRERLAESGRDLLVWEELQHHLDERAHAVHAYLRHETNLTRFYLRQDRRKQKQVALMATARKMLKVIY